MAEAVDARLRDRRAPRGAGGHRHRQVAGLPGARDRARHRDRPSRWSSRRRPSRCNASCSTATCRGWPTPWPAHCPASPSSPCSRAAETTCASTRFTTGRRRARRGPSAGGAVRRRRGHRAGPRRQAAHRVGVGHRDRRPRRAGARRARPVVEPGQRVGPGVHRRDPLPVRHRLLRREGQGPAGSADVVVTNHALLAIDAIADVNVLPEHDLLVVDEAHELVDRVTSVATGELSATVLGVAHRRVGAARRPRTRATPRGRRRRRSRRRSTTRNPAARTSSTTRWPPT